MVVICKGSPFGLYAVCRFVRFSASYFFSIVLLSVLPGSAAVKKKEAAKTHVLAAPDVALIKGFKLLRHCIRQKQSVSCGL